MSLGDETQQRGTVHVSSAAPCGIRMHGVMWSNPGQGDMLFYI